MSDCMRLEGLERLRDGLAEEALGAVREVCEQIKDDSAALCPVDSGALRASIRMDAALDGDCASGTVSAGESYAAAVELGAWGRPAQPFLEPAFASRADGLAGLLASRISASR